MRIIMFNKPILNIEGRFNTVRLGGKLGRELAVGEEVLLVDANKSSVMCRASVESTEIGPLNVMAQQHAAITTRSLSIQKVRHNV